MTHSCARAAGQDSHDRRAKQRRGLTAAAGRQNRDSPKSKAPARMPGDSPKRSFAASTRGLGALVERDSLSRVGLVWSRSEASEVSV